jgi:predicted aspartyl protease
MPVRNYPFSVIRPGDVARPYLPIAILNPNSGIQINVYALIDTGADECAFPASFAPLLGHDLPSGQEKRVTTGNGITIAYSHTNRIIVGSAP